MIGLAASLIGAAVPPPPPASVQRTIYEWQCGDSEWSRAVVEYDVRHIAIDRPAEAPERGVGPYRLTSLIINGHERHGNQFSEMQQYVAQAGLVNWVTGFCAGTSQEVLIGRDLISGGEGERERWFMSGNAEEKPPE